MGRSRNRCHLGHWSNQTRPHQFSKSEQSVKLAELLFSGGTVPRAPMVHGGIKHPTIINECLWKRYKVGKRENSLPEEMEKHHE
ncbi:hypothetical protein E1B28_006414 [Marasmius oreades]|uniref:Uncharacterized protein n=1 Tax=Marasmius oreades TaxID=181124 RepID=A0A9P7S5K2_9AGAR|nr:uncharacterized protein E1B28_006414 [Marasmius oreades]KAG7095700.1 hypothetical protein E1B28_006414 [Marasmius oreades]